MKSNKKGFYIETYGCEMNKSDSIDIALSFEKSGYERVEHDQEADIVVLNTCAVRAHAEDRIIGRLGYYRYLKERQNRDIIIVLAGCMAQEQEGKIRALFPEIAIVAGTYHCLKIPQFVREYEGARNPLIAVDKDMYEFSPYRRERAEIYKAWLNIIHGCSNFCSYCIVPYLRGPEKSKKSSDILHEVEELTASGVVEITLLGQNVNAYGKDTNDISFIELLEKINDIKGLRWIRFLTSHPKDFNEDIIKRASALDKVCRHLHLPVQSGSDRILSLMNRRYRISHYLKIVEAIHKYIPDASITTDIVVGFPSETEKDFNETLNVVRDVQFDDAYTYRYSDRPYTKAKNLPGKLSEDITKERLQELIALQREISYKKNIKEIGMRREALIERQSKKNEKEFLAKTEKGKMVVVQTKRPVGSFLDIYIRGISGNTLKGEEIYVHE